MLKGMIILLGTLITLGGTMAHVANSNVPQEEQPMICKAKPNGLQDCEVVSQEEYEKHQEQQERERREENENRRVKSHCSHNSTVRNIMEIPIDGLRIMVTYEDGCTEFIRYY